MGVKDFAVVVDLAGLSLQGSARICVGAEKGSGIISNPAVEHEEPPVPSGEEPLDFEIVLRTAARGKWCETDTRIDLRVVLDPALDVTVPASLVVGEAIVAIGCEEGEEMGCSNLLWVVDPVVVSSILCSSSGQLTIQPLLSA